MSKKHWRNLIQDQKYLGSWDLEVDGKYTPVVVTIEKIYVGDFTSQGGTETKPIVKLREFQKPMVLQIANFTRMEKLFGTMDWEQYIGKQIVLGVENVKFKGDVIPALRFSSRPVPQQTKADLPVMTDAEFDKALANFKAGKTTVEKLESLRTLTAEQKAQLV